MKRSDLPMAEGILFTDQYQLTMAHLYYRMGLHEKQVQFDHFFRHYPAYDGHHAGYCINAGLEWLLDWMEWARFGDGEGEDPWPGARGGGGRDGGWGNFKPTAQMGGGGGAARSKMTSWIGCGVTGPSIASRCGRSQRGESFIRMSP